MDHFSLVFKTLLIPADREFNRGAGIMWRSTFGGLLALILVACSSGPDLVDTASEDPGTPDGGERIAQSSQALTNFPVWFRMRENGGSRCISSGPIVGSVQAIFGQETCAWNPQSFFQGSNGTNLHINTWDAFCLDGTLQPGNSFNLTGIVSCGSTNAESWSFGAGGHTQQWVNLNEGMCMTCARDCFMAPCVASPTDQVYQLDISTPTIPAFVIAPYFPALPNLCMGPANGANSVAGTRVLSMRCTNTIEQFWTVSGNLIVWATTSLCLDKPAGQNGAGTGVFLQPCTGAANQQWVRGAPNDYVNVESGLCLDVPGHALGQSNLQVWTCNGGLNQQFGGPHS